MKFLLLLILIFPVSGFSLQENSTELDTVIVEDTYIDPPLDYPSAFSTSIELEEFSGEFNTTAEILSFSPGVFVRDFGGLGQLKTISIRGSSNDQVVILLDGVRLNNPLGGGVDLSTIPLDFVEKFEIVRGGASALAGSDALGGVVNIVTKPTDVPFTLASATYGSFETFGINASRAQKIGNFSYLVSLSHARSEGDFKFKSVNDLTLTRINNDFHSESLFWKVQYEKTDRTITLMNEFFYDDRGVPGLGEFQEPDSNQKDIRNLTSLTINKENFINPDLDFNIIFFNRFDMLEFTNPEPILGPPIDTLSKTYSFGVNPTIVWYAPYNQLITFSSEIRAVFLRNEDFDNPKRLTASLFASDEIVLFDELLTLNPIFRYDLYRTWGDLNDSFDSGISPRLGIVVSPLNYLSFKGNIGRSYRAPNFSELFFPDEGFISGNPNLKPETSFDFDLGFVISHPIISFQAVYFRNKIDDLILFVFISATRIEPRNVGKVTEQGFETSIVLRPLSYIEILGSYTFLDGELEDTGAQLPGRPRNKLDIRAVLKTNIFKIYWETHYVDSIPVTPFPNSRSTDPRTTYDVGVNAEWDNIFLTFEIKNLLNNLDVRDALDFPLPGRSFFVTAGTNF